MTSGIRLAAIVCTLGLGLGSWAAPLPPTGPTASPAPAGKSADVASSVELALSRLNRMRRMAGLQPVTLDPSLSRGCELHARYLELNYRTLAARRQSLHEEDTSLPGASEEGRAAGFLSVIARRQSLDAAVQAFLATMYHRAPLLRPGLRRVGMGFSGRMAVINIHSGVEGEDDQPVAFPVAGQSDVPLEFPWEQPDPLPPTAARPAGFPITLHFPLEGPEVQEVAAELSRGDGPVPCFVSTPEKPAGSFPQMNTVCLIPQRRLLPNTVYTVVIKGRFAEEHFRKQWTFTTTATAVP